MTMIYNSITDFKSNIKHDHSIMALDFGDSKTGIAISDKMQQIASPREVYKNQNSSKDLGYISRFIKENEVGALVVGFPLELDGSEGAPCEKVRKFTEKLYKKTGLPIFLQDERFSTVAVKRDMSTSRMKSKTRHEIDDKLAAGYILQMVLDQI